MKTNVLLIAALFSLSASVCAVAKEDPRNVGFAVVPVTGSNVYKVIYKNEGASRVKLNLYNSSGEVIFSETINTDGFIRPLNFSGLNPGEYTIEVNDGNAKRAEKISYNLPAVSATTTSAKIVHVTKVKGTDEKFVLSIANAKNENFVIRIFGEGGKIIYSETVYVDGSDAKLFNVTNAKVSRFEVTDASGVESVKKF